MTTATQTVIARTSTTATVAITCPFCGKVNNVTVPITGVMLRLKGANIQDAFPELTPDERELLISGICKECWDEMFA